MQKNTISLDPKKQPKRDQNHSKFKKKIEEIKLVLNWYSFFNLIKILHLLKIEDLRQKNNKKSLQTRDHLGLII